MERDTSLVRSMHRIAARETRAGYRTVFRYLRREGWVVNKKRVHRLWKKEGLKVPPRARKRKRLGESFHGRLRDECLNPEQFWTLTEARVVIEDYLREYNTFRPHSKLGYLSPERFAARKSAISVSGRPTASLRRRWTTQQQPTRNQNNPQRLTLMWSNFPSPVRGNHSEAVLLK
jgi:transposase InsO family protein